MKVLVTDGESRAALAATRSLGRVGEVHVVAEGSTSLASVSRRATAGHSVPSPLGEPDGFASGVEAIARTLRADAILPVSDAACCALLPVRERLAPSVLVAPPATAYATLSDKAAVASLAANRDIEIPPGAEAASVDEACAVAAELGWPVILKPVRSVVVGPDGRVRKAGVERIDGPDAMRAAWRRSVGSDKALVQKIVPGRGEGIFLLRTSGRTWAAFAHRRLREKPPEGGVSVLRESVALRADLRDRVERVLDDVGFDGVAMAEFRCDGEHAWLMEFNARLWGSLQLAIDAGVDFPRMMVEAALGRRPRPVSSYALGVRSRWLLGDLDHALALARGARDAEGRSGVVAALRVLACPSGPDTRFEVLRRDDPRPFLHELKGWIAQLLGSLRGAA